MNKNSFVVKASGKKQVRIYFAQAEPLTACVAKITEREGEEVKHTVIAQGYAIHNPKDKWDELTGKQRAFGRMKADCFSSENVFTTTTTTMVEGYCGMLGKIECIVNFGNDSIPTEHEIEHAFYEWMKWYKSEEK